LASAGESSAPILKSPLDFSADRVARTVGIVFVGGGAVNVNCLGVGASKIGDCGDVPNTLASLFVDAGVSTRSTAASTRNALALLLNDALFFVPLVEAAPMVNVLGGVNRAPSLASESFGESTTIGSGDVIGSGDRAGSDAVSFSNSASNDLAARGAPESSRVKFCWLALRARPGLFSGIARSSNVFTGLSRPDDVASRSNFSANAPQVARSSPPPRSLLAALALGVLAAPFARARKLRPLSTRARPASPAPRLNRVNPSSTSFTASRPLVAAPSRSGAAFSSVVVPRLALLPLSRSSVPRARASTSRAGASRGADMARRRTVDARRARARRASRCCADPRARSGAVTARARCAAAITAFNSSARARASSRARDDEVVHSFVDYHSDRAMWCYIGREANERGFRRGFVRTTVSNHERSSRHVRFGGYNRQIRSAR
jgi:hypothetical protein